MLKKAVVLVGFLVSLSAVAGTPYPQKGDRGFWCTAFPGTSNELCLSASDTKQVVLQWSARCYSKSKHPSGVAKLVTCDGKYHVLHRSPVVTKDSSGKSFPEKGDVGFGIRFGMSNDLFANAQLLQLSIKLNNCSLILDPVLKDGRWVLPDFYNKKSFDCSGNSYDFEVVPNFWDNSNSVKQGNK